MKKKKEEKPVDCLGFGNNFRYRNLRLTKERVAAIIHGGC